MIEFRASQVIGQAKSLCEELLSIKKDNNNNNNNNNDDNNNKRISEYISSNHESPAVVVVESDEKPIDRKSLLLGKLNNNKLVALVLQLQQEVEQKTKKIDELQTYIMDL